MDQYRVVDGAMGQGAPLWTEPNWRGIGAEVGGSEGETIFTNVKLGLQLLLLQCLLILSAADGWGVNVSAGAP